MNPVPATIVDLLRQRADRTPDALAFVILADGETEEERITVGELDARARALAAVLAERAPCGSRILLLLPTGISFLVGFFGSLYAGMIAVPAYPPGNSARKRHDSRVSAIARNAGCAIALLDRRGRTAAEALFQDEAAPPIELLDIDAIGVPAGPFAAPAVGPESIAFLQYTSGSTASPRGVMVTHANLVHNQRVIQAACDHDENSTFVGWTPLYHDLGLIGSVLQPLFIGAPSVLMPPTAFLTRPVRWLRAISEYRAHTSGGPNFAYDICIDRIQPEDAAGLDLRCWRVAFNGAEPVRRDTLERFAQAFAPHGYSPVAGYPCYGLAETTLMVTGGSKHRGPIFKAVRTHALERHAIVDAPLDAAGARVLVGCGRTQLDTRVVIVDPETRTQCDSTRLGEIWVAGGSVTAGYWNAPEETAACFNARVPGLDQSWVRTGDLGFLDDGELFITGRLKDLIVIRGVNHYPQDIELTAERASDRLPRHANAAFSLVEDGDERLVIVQEIDRGEPAALDAVVDRMRADVAREHGLQATIVLVRKGSVPRTTSGKIQRRLCRARWLAGELPVVLVNAVGAASMERADAARQPEPRDEAAPTRAVLSSLVRGAARHLKLDESRIDVSRALVSLGLDSLACVELQHALAADLGVTAEIGQLMSDVSIHALAAALAAQANPTPTRTAHANEIREAPLSSEQLRLWLLAQRPVGPPRNVAALLRLDRVEDVAALRRSLADVVMRHPALRLVFQRAERGVVQRIADLDPAALDILSLVEVDAPSSARTIAAESARHFNLGAAPKLHAVLLRHADHDQLLLVSHHIVADAWSMGILFRDVLRAYRGARARITEAAGVSMRPFLSHVCESVARPLDATASKFWTEALAHLPPPIEFPTEPEARSSAGPHRILLELPDQTVTRVKEFAGRHATTPFVVLLAVLQTLIHRRFQRDDLVIAVPVHGRDGDTGDVVGFFAHPVVVRQAVSDALRVRELVAAVRDRVVQAYDRRMPFADIVRAADAQAESSVRTLCQVMCSHLRLAAQWADDGVTADAIDVASGAMDADLFCTVIEDDERIRISVAWHERFAEAPMRQLVETLPGLIRSFTDDAEMRLVDVDRAARADTAGVEGTAVATIGIVATFAVNPIEESLAFWATELDVPMSVSLSPYGQVYSELLNPASALSTNRDGVNAVLLRIEDWTGPLPEGAVLSEATRRRVSEHAGALVDGLRAYTSREHAPCLLCLCPASPTALATPRFEELSRECEASIAEAASRWPGVRVLTPHALMAGYDIADYYDGHADRSAHMPYTRELYAAFGTAITRAVLARSRPPYKVIAVDADNTLWSGVCGEDGPDGVMIDSGRAALQHFLLAQSRAGVVLVLCSRNNPADVSAVFERAPAMILRADDFVATAVSWDAKSQGLHRLARDLGVALDSFVFLDDSPVECAEVEAHCPGVRVLNLPHDSGQIAAFLARVWAFDAWAGTREDRERTAFYRQNAERARCRDASADYVGFVESLDVRVGIRAADAGDLDRVSQLTYRTTQLNASGKRRTSTDLVDETRRGTRADVVEASDRFGDYGLVGAIISRAQAGRLDVDTFLLSCRALGRGVEQQMLRWTGQIAAAQGLAAVHVSFVATDRNEPCRRLVESARRACAGTWDDAGVSYPSALLAGFTPAIEPLPAAAAAGPGDARDRRAPRRAIDLVPEHLCRIGDLVRAIDASRLRRRSDVIERPYAGPRTDTEQALCATLQQVLHFDRVGVDDDFLDLGGESIAMMQVIAHVQQVYGVELPIRLFFEAPTVAALAQALDALRAESAISAS